MIGRQTWVWLVAVALLSWTACKKADDDDATPGDDDDTTPADDDDTAVDDDDTAADDDDTAADDDDDTAASDARWTMMVFLNGDNDLESWVVHDLNELELVGSGDGVHVVVQADRIDGYSTEDGDWTDARRYYITPDGDMGTISSTVVEQIGEVDMGDPAVLSDFVMWAHENYPAEHYALVLWDHGDTWYADQPAGDPLDGIHEMVSSDDTSGSYLSIAEGDLIVALTDIVAARGPVDVVAFDACSMASWEVAHSLQGLALTMAAAETTTGMNGYMYDSIIALMRDVAADPDARDVAIEFARSAVEDGGENTHSAFDLTAMGPLAAAMDDLAGAVLADGSLETPLIEARDAARGMDPWYHDWYLDQGDFAAQLTGADEPALATAGQDILDALDDAILASYGSGAYGWASGSMIFFDLDWPMYLDLYVNGAGATWSVDTRWDDLLVELASH